LDESFTFYPSVADLFLSLKSLPNPPILAIASRSSTPQLAAILLKELHLPHPSSSSAGDIPAAALISKESTKAPLKAAHEFFDCIKIFPGDKKRHFAEIRKVTGVGYEEMVFFDDEVRNRNVEALGVVMLLVENGVSASEVDKGVREWRRRKGKEKEVNEADGGGR
jgi:magnesium-dependent phosphatase 1